MQSNDISEIINMKMQDISPAVYHMLQNSQPTFASAKKSFSILKKLLAKDRNFKVENVRHYMILHFNAFTWRFLASKVNYVARLTYFAIAIALCSKFR